MPGLQPCLLFVMAAVSVVLPWSTWPMVPTFTWGLSRTYVFLASTARPRHKRDCAGDFSGHNRPCSRGVGPAPRPDRSEVWSQGAGPSPGIPDDSYVSPGRHRPPRPLTAEEGRRAQQSGGRHCGRTHAPSIKYRLPERAIRKGQLRLKGTSGGSEDWEGKSGRL